MKEAELSITAEDGAKMIDLAIEKFETATRSKKFSGFGDGLNILVDSAFAGHPSRLVRPRRPGKSPYLGCVGNSNIRGKSADRTGDR